jgi:hypothetical protein
MAKTSLLFAWVPGAAFPGFAIGESSHSDPPAGKSISRTEDNGHVGERDEPV